jgi:hypothetical protein
MAKLPRSPISVDVQTNYRPVREARASGADPVGQAMEQVGNAGFEIATRMADAKIAADAAEASIRLRSRLDEESRAIENDMEGDPAGFEARFRERAAAIANEEAGKMSSPAMKRAFALKAQEQTETYSINMRDVTRRRQVEGVKAQTMKVGADYELLAKDPSKPRELLEQSRDDYLALIDRQQKAGIYTPDVAEAARIAANEVYRAGVTTRHLTNVDTMLDAGRYGEAEEYFKANYGEMDPAQREKAEQVLETKRRDGQAVSLADEYWAASGSNYGAAIAEAAKIEDPDLRLKTEARIAQLESQRTAAEGIKDDADWNAGMEYVTTGRPIPASIMREASPKVRDLLQTEERSRALWAQQMATASAEERAALRELSMGNYRSLKAAVISDPELAMAGTRAVLADPYLADLYQNMTQDERGQFDLDMANAAKNGGAPVDSVSKAYKAVVAVAGVYLPEGLTAKKYSDKFKGLGEGDPAARKYGADKTKKDPAILFERELMRLVEDEVRRTGNPEIPADRAKQLIALSYAAAGKKEDGSTAYPISQDLAGGIVSTQAQRDVLDFRRMNPDLWSEATAMVRSKYPEASDALILAEARRIRAYQDAEAAAGFVGSLFGGKKE